MPFLWVAPDVRNKRGTCVQAGPEIDLAFSSVPPLLSLLLLCRVLSYLVLSCLVFLFVLLFCLVLSVWSCLICHVMSCHVESCPVLFCFVLFCFGVVTCTATNAARPAVFFLCPSCRIDCLYVEQEVVADDTPAVIAVMKADKARQGLGIT